MVQACIKLLPLLLLTSSAAPITHSLLGDEWSCQFPEDTGSGKRCTINVSIDQPAPLAINFDGDIVVTGGCQVSSKAGLSVVASGSLLVQQAATVKGRDLLLNASAVSIVNGSSLQALGQVHIVTDAKPSAASQQAELLRFRRLERKHRIGDPPPLGRGEVLFDASTVSANSVLISSAVGVSIKGPDVTHIAHQSFVVGASMQNGNCTNGLTLQDASVHSALIDLSCNLSKVRLLGNMELSVHDPDGNVRISGQSIEVDDGVSMFSPTIDVSADQHIGFHGKLPGFTGSKPPSTSQPSKLSMTTQGNMVAGHQNDTWQLSGMFASGFTVKIRDWSKINVQGQTSCMNKGGSTVEDRCEAVLSSWPPWLGAWPANTGTSSSVGATANLSFDLTLVARDTLIIATGSQMRAASSLLCSGNELEMMDSSKVDASGRGCPHDEGISPGLMPDAKDRLLCGAGGGAHVGQGGFGSSFDSASLTPCKSTHSGPAYDRQDYRVLLPTQGASGGGSDGKTSTFSSLASRPEPIGLPVFSAGGGLIWLSGSHSVQFGKRVVLNADGMPGNVVPVEEGRARVSGAGAGGQVFIFSKGDVRAAGAHSTDALDKARLSAAGGAVSCTRNANPGAAGGAGGGGFVGLHWTNRPAPPDPGLPGLFRINPSPGPPPAGQGFVVDVSGGMVAQDETQDCAWSVPASGQQAAYGQTGLAASLVNCPNGSANLFCELCPPGTWSNGSFQSCRPCHNKPSKGNYTKWGWYNDKCPFDCSVGVPNVASNPKCLDPLDYALRFFGGTKGLLAIAASIFLAALLLLWRGSAKGNRTRQARSRGISESTFITDNFDQPQSHRWFCTPSDARAKCCFCCRRHRSGANGETDTLPPAESRGTGSSGEEMMLPSEQLPFHVCRVYFQGDNRVQSPWSLSRTLPASVEQLVAPEQWLRLAASASSLAEISAFDARLDAVLVVLYPPLAPLAARWMRLRRARKLCSLVREFSEGQSEQSSFWKPIRARGLRAGELSMAFGCDRSATLGHLDFFDSSRSRLDWAPVNLRHEAWLLPAHGHGTYADPYELDIKDPLSTCLEQGDFGPHAVCSVIATFNRISRTLSEEELQSGHGSSLLQRLRDTVERCAERCGGLRGCVQVVVVAMERELQQEDQPVTATPSEQGASLQEGPSSARRGSSRMPSFALSQSLQDQVSFSDLVQQQRPRQTVPRRPAKRQRHAVEESTQSIGRLGLGHDLRLCLAFAQFPSLADVHSPLGIGSPGSPSSPTGMGGARSSLETRSDVPQTLTTPMSHQGLCRLIQSRGHPSEGFGSRQLTNVVSPSASHSSAHSARSSMASEKPQCIQQLRRFLLSWRNKAEDRPAVALLTVLLLLAFDLMAFVLVFWILFKTSLMACTVWIFLPPLAQPLAIIVGPIFLFTEDPSLGRLFASLELLGTINAILALLVLILLLLVDSLLFDFGALSIVAVAKGILFAAASAHVANLEAARDLSFADTSQADFVGRILSTGEPDLVEEETEEQQVTMHGFPVDYAEPIEPPRSRSSSSWAQSSVGLTLDNYGNRASKSPTGSWAGSLATLASKQAPSQPSPF
eukprot:TRINITY_DN19909_c0_g1_i1.p1 TRINITY_DN19909_c0_g1~~TRINITY_DN19909_c0_g1_i1.p1  ORF type:complete len:1589 (+),score=265.49 TRINITY_DN19909_c0_g1_i1:35-4768(+)